MHSKFNCITVKYNGRQQSIYNNLFNLGNPFYDLFRHTWMPMDSPVSHMILCREGKQGRNNKVLQRKKITAPSTAWHNILFLQLSDSAIPINIITLMMLFFKIISKLYSIDYQPFVSLAKLLNFKILVLSNRKWKDTGQK